MQKEEQVSFLAEKIRQADAVLIGVVLVFPVRRDITIIIGYPIWRNVYRFQGVVWTEISL